MSKATATLVRATISAGRHTIERFDGQDYLIWAKHMQNILRECKLLKYTDNDDEVEGEYNDNEDEQALAEIQFTFGNSQMRHIMQCRTAKEVWDKLQSKHTSASKSNRLQMKNQFL